MARPRRMTTSTNNGAVEPSANLEPRQTRRKRVPTPPPDTLHETMTLISAVLESRRDKGATPELLHRVVSWARAIREEGEDIRVASQRIRRTKGLLTPERLVRYETNRALLEGVLAGRIQLQVQDDGSMRFVYDEPKSAPTVVSAHEPTE